eukprot:g3675.t1
MKLHWSSVSSKEGKTVPCQLSLAVAPQQYANFTLFGTRMDKLEDLKSSGSCYKCDRPGLFDWSGEFRCGREKSSPLASSPIQLPQRVGPLNDVKWFDDDWKNGCSFWSGCHQLDLMDRLAQRAFHAMQIEEQVEYDTSDDDDDDHDDNSDDDEDGKGDGGAAPDSAGSAGSGSSSTKMPTAKPKPKKKANAKAAKNKRGAHMKKNKNKNKKKPKKPKPKPKPKAPSATGSQPAFGFPNQNSVFTAGGSIWVCGESTWSVGKNDEPLRSPTALPTKASPGPAWPASKCAFGDTTGKPVAVLPGVDSATPGRHFGGVLCVVVGLQTQCAYYSAGVGVLMSSDGTASSSTAAKVEGTGGATCSAWEGGYFRTALVDNTKDNWQFLAMKYAQKEARQRLSKKELTLCSNPSAEAGKSKAEKPLLGGRRWSSSRRQK